MILINAKHVKILNFSVLLPIPATEHDAHLIKTALFVNILELFVIPAIMNLTTITTIISFFKFMLISS